MFKCNGYQWALISLLFLAGCGFTKYQAKPISPQQAAAQWQARRLDDSGFKNFLDSTRHKPSLVWPPPLWELPELDLAALYFHPDIKIARAQWEARQANELIAKQRQNPSFGSNSALNTPVTPGVFPFLIYPSIDFTIETAGKRKFRMLEAASLRHAAYLGLIQTAWQVKTRFREAYLFHESTRLTARLINEQVKLRQEQLDSLNTLVRLGEISRPALAPYQLEWQQAQLNRVTISGTEEESRADLASSLGVSFATVASLNIPPEPFSDFQIPDTLFLDSIRQNVLTNNASIQRALAEYQAAEAALRLEIARQYPDLRFGPGIRFAADQTRYVPAFSFDLPILNKNQGAIALAMARRKEAEAQLIKIQADLLTQAESAFAIYTTSKRSYKTITVLLAEATQREADTRVMLALGEVDYLALLLNRLEKNLARQTILKAQHQLYQAWNRLEFLMQSPEGLYDWPNVVFPAVKQP